MKNAKFMLNTGLPVFVQNLAIFADRLFLHDFPTRSITHGGLHVQLDSMNF